MGDCLWDEFLAGAPAVRLNAGRVVFRTGSPPRLAAVRSGMVRVFTYAPGGRQVPIRYVRPGDLVGLEALLGENDLLSAEAVSDTVLVMVSIQRLRALAAQHPELSWMIASQIGTWAVVSIASLVGAGFEQMTVRVAQHLMDLAVRTPDDRTVAYVTHRALADAVGTVREVITRVLGEFRHQGILDTRPGRVILLDPGRLSRVAQGEQATGQDAYGPGREAEEMVADMATIIPGRPAVRPRFPQGRPVERAAAAAGGGARPER
jgi:CRP/FNR family transcriptional regulator, cyclic AMP receptor protein